MEVVGSSPTMPTNVSVTEWLGSCLQNNVIQVRILSDTPMVPSSRRPRTLACHASNMGSNPIGTANAGIAQLVEHLLAKQKVACSNHVTRSILINICKGVYDSVRRTG